MTLDDVLDFIFFLEIRRIFRFYCWFLGVFFVYQ